MGRENGGYGYWPVYLLIVIISFIVVDTVFLARWNGYLKIPGEMTEVDLARCGGRALVRYFQAVAISADVSDEESVQKALAAMKAALRRSETSQAIAEIVNRSREIQAVLVAERKRRQKDYIVRLIQSDPRVAAGEQNGDLITVSGQVAGLGAEVVGGRELLSLATLEKLEKSPYLQDFSGMLNLEIRGTTVHVLTPVDNMAQMRALKQELDDLRRSLDRVRELTGRTTISGPGVVVRAADALDGYLWAEIVHEEDIRDIVNSLYYAGARGVEIGGQRLGSGGWVRCVGPVVVVNGKTVAANPIVVKAVGDPDKLAASLADLQDEFILTGKHLDVEKKARVSLVPFTGSP